MMSFFSKVLVFLMIVAFYCWAYAAQAPEDLQVTASSDTTLDIDWQDAVDVLWYYIYYGKSSWVDWDYDIEWVDLIENSNFELTGLDPDTNYFIAVTSVDDTWSESPKSVELEATTLSPWTQEQAASLRIVEASAVDDTSIEMIFSLDMESGSNVQRQFIIENIDTGEEIGVDISDTVPGENQKIIALLDGNLKANSTYKITILDIRDADGNTIESGIDAFVNFTTPSVFTTVLESAGQETTNSEEEEVIEITSDPIVDQETEETQITEAPTDEAPSENMTKAWNVPSWNNAGTNISNEDIAGNTLSAAADNEKLPQTGPEHWILFLIAIMLSTGVFYKMRK